MWVTEHCYEITKEERQLLNERLRSVYSTFGQEIKPIEEPDMFGGEDTTTIAYMEHHEVTGEVHIRCGKFWNDETNIIPVITMLHELGHYIDLTANHDNSMSRYIWRIGTLESEVRAWEIGISLAKQVIPDRYYEVMEKYAIYCLSTYFEGFQYFPLDIKFNFCGTPPTFDEAQRRVKKAMSRLEA